MITRRRRKSLFGMFKVFTHILIFKKTFILPFFDLKNQLDCICINSFWKLQILDYILYKIFRKFFILNSCLNYNYTFYSVLTRYRFNNKFADFLCIGSFTKSKLYWTNFSYNPIKFFNVSKNNFKTSSFYVDKSPDKNSLLTSLVNLKKNSGLMKKKDRRTYNTLLNTHSLRNYKFYQNNFLTNKSVDFSKVFDLKRRTLKNFIMNRQIFKDSILLKNTRQSKLTKFISKNSGNSVFYNVVKYENSLMGLLVKSKFVFTLSDANFLIKNKFVYLNNSLCINPFNVVKKFDLVNLVFTEKYFKFFKSIFNSNVKMSSFLSYRLWRYNRFRSNFYKQSPTTLPTWINKLDHFYQDIPSYLEVDYLTLSFVLLRDFSLNSFYFSKNINIFMFRLYNWKYLT